jgi:hypothetical protein
MAAVAGLRGTGDWGADERPKNFREMIMWRNPNGATPLFALMSKVGKKSVDDYEFSWWDEPVTIIRLQVNGAPGSTVADTLITVDSGDPSTTNPERNWGTAKHLTEGDLLMVEPSDEANFSTTEYLVVVQVLSDTQFIVRRGQLGSSAAAIADDAWLLKVGSVFGDGTHAPKATSRNPVKYTNYTQIFKTTYDISGRAKETKIRTGDPLANEKKRRSTDHSKDIEFAMMFGRKSEVVTDGKVTSTTDGLRRQIPAETTTIFSTALTVNSFLDAVYKVFDWDTDAGTSRIGLCGNLALNVINKQFRSDSNTEIQFAGKIKQYGMELMTISLPQGEIHLKTHPLMNRHPTYSKAMFLIDFSALKWRPMRNRDTKFFDNIQDKDEDAQRGYWMTDAGLEVSYGGLSCGYLGNFTASP